MGDVILSTDIQGLLDGRRAVLKLLKQALESFSEAAAIASQSGFGNHNLPDWFRVIKDHIYHDPVQALPDIEKLMNQSGWRYLMYASGMGALMDTQTKEAFEAQLASEVPELTAENILATFKDLFAKKQSMFEQGVINCFRCLSWDYKSNSTVAFGRKIILDGVVSFHPDYGFRTEYRMMERVEDLERIFYILDGKPVPEHRHMVGMKMSDTLMRDRFLDQMTCEYFHLKWYRKGSMHIIFRRRDLVKKINRILAKHYPATLPNAKMA